MRDFGTHSIPVVTTLPGTGVAGQLVSYQYIVYYWHTGFQAWQPIMEDNQIVLSSTFSTTSTSLVNVFSAPVLANATYTVNWNIMWQTSLLTFQMKQAFISPSGATQSIISNLTGSPNGTVTPTCLELGTSGLSQLAPSSASITAYSTNIGSGLVKTGSTAGTMALQTCASAALGAVLISAGSVFTYRRIL